MTVMERVQEQQNIDLEKTNFALKKNIPLMRVPYWKRNYITKEDILYELSQ